jgi:hypothetical protein
MDRDDAARRHGGEQAARPGDDVLNAGIVDHADLDEIAGDADCGRAVDDSRAGSGEFLPHDRIEIEHG